MIVRRRRASAAAAIAVFAAIGCNRTPRTSTSPDAEQRGRDLRTHGYIE